MKTGNRGFTLTELLVTVLLAVLVVSISFPTIQGLRRRSYSVSCSANLRQLGSGLNLYLGDHANKMPTMLAAVSEKSPDKPTADRILADYVDDPLIFRCPGDKQQLYEKTGTSYLWNHLLNGQLAGELKFLAMDGDHRIPVFADKEGFHYGVGDAVQVLYADGSVEKDFKFWVDELKNR